MSALTKTAPIQFAGLADEGLAVKVGFSNLEFVVIARTNSDLDRFLQVLGFNHVGCEGPVRVVVIQQSRTQPLIT